MLSTTNKEVILQDFETLIHKLRKENMTFYVEKVTILKKKVEQYLNQEEDRYTNLR